MGSFIFWLIWPVIVSSATARYYKKYTGRDIPKDKVRKLRKDLAEITGPIMKPVPTPVRK